MLLAVMSAWAMLSFANPLLIWPHTTGAKEAFATRMLDTLARLAADLSQ